MKYFDEQMAVESAFFLFAAMSVISAISLLFARNIINAAYSLFVTLFCIAALFIFAKADFLAISQIMIYIGGVLILLIFSIMLTHKKNHALQTNIPNKIAVSNQNLFWGFFTMFVSMAFFIKAIFKGHFVLRHTQESSITSTLKPIGLQLMTNYVFVFEVAGVLLLFTLIGATYIAKK